MTKLDSFLHFDDALALALAGAPPEERWLAALLTASDQDAPRMFEQADRLRRQHVGDEVHLRALIEFSNHCKRNCNYCGLRHDNRHIARYRMSIDDIERAALEAEELNYRTVVLQSGEDPWYTRDRMAEIIGRIRARTRLAITLSVGERDLDTYRAWRQAGADRCLVRIETTDPTLFRALHPDDDFENRKRCILWLRDLGYQLGSGVMVGLPGQTAEMLARDVIWLHEVGAEMIGVGPFIPHPDTPLHGVRGGTVEQTLRLVSVLRLVIPWAHIPATTAMGTLDPLGREKALQAGANVMMPNITPVSYRASYEIYPNKICTGDDARTCAGCVRGRLASIGRTIATDQGHVLRGADRQRAPVCDPARRHLVVLQ